MNLIFLTCILFTNYISSIQFELDPVANMTTKQIIEYYGYPVEEYTIETQDGYLLNVQRIPRAKNASDEMVSKKPVIIQHGLFAASDCWVLNIAEKDLPFILADAGYDVWLSNVRGTLYGHNNTHFTPDDKRFWQFSFDEMAQYDLPSIIDFMLNVTSSKQVYYIGHSMGTTILFALLSSQPKYNDIIKAAFAMAPIINLHHSRGGVTHLFPIAKQLYWISNLLSNGQFNLDKKIVHFLATTICDSSITIEICQNILFFLSGAFDHNQFNTSRLPVYMYHFPHLVSTRTLYHYYQLSKSKEFQKFDFGQDNVKHYNQTSPPIYNVSAITCPIALFWAQGDYLADPLDIAQLLITLKNVPLLYRVPYSKFNHLDFVIAIDVKTLLYDKLLNAMQKLWP